MKFYNKYILYIYVDNKLPFIIRSNELLMNASKAIGIQCCRKIVSAKFAGMSGLYNNSLGETTKLERAVIWYQARFII